MITIEDNIGIWKTELLQELEKNSPMVLKHCLIDSPIVLKQMVINWLAPFTPLDQWYALTLLCFDQNETIAQKASLSLSQALEEQGEQVLLPNLMQFSKAGLGLIGFHLLNFKDSLVTLITLKQCPLDILPVVADCIFEEVLVIIARKIEYCAQTPALLERLRKNSHLPISAKDRLFEDIIRLGTYDEAITHFIEFQEGLKRLKADEICENIILNPQLDEFIETNIEQSENISSVNHHVEQKDDKNLFQLLLHANTAQKIKLGFKGNKEVRTLLLRSPLRIIALAAISNPRINEGEIIGAVNNKSIHEEVLKYIAGSREMTRSYKIKKALIYNPKSPFQLTMRFLSHMRLTDLKAISKSRDIPQALRAQAMRLLNKRKN